MKKVMSIENHIMKQLKKFTPAPNLFSYATSELSQDAFICWLIKWSENATDLELKDLGHRFVNALMSKWEGPEIKEVSKAEVER